MPSPHAQQQQQRSAPNNSDVLRQQQQRLLLLRHASKCPISDKCPATSHCQEMKILWKHIAGCKDPHCQTVHCVSSRFVLAHYHKCVDTNCGVCEPVRMAIKKNEPKTPNASASASSNNNYAPSPSDLVSRYVMLWKQISSNATVAREKQSKLEFCTSELQQKEQELMHANEEESLHNMVMHRDEAWEEMSSRLKMKLEECVLAVKSCQRQRAALDSEVSKMRQAHDKNVELEKLLQGEFIALYPGEAGKNAILHARNEAQHGMIQSQYGSAHHLTSSANNTPKSATIPIAKVDTQSVINQQILKQKGKAALAAATGKEPKKPRKSKDSGSSSSQGSPSSSMVVHQNPRMRLFHHGPEIPIKVFRDCPTVAPVVFETSLINSFNRLDILSHVSFLKQFNEVTNKSSRFRDLCLTLLKRCQDQDGEKVFAQPVDPILHDAPGYLEIIKQPRDFHTIREKIENGDYSQDFQLFLTDMRLVFSNCLLYNPPGVINSLGLKIGQLFEREYVALLELEDSKGPSKHDLNNCSLCFGRKLMFEATVFFCSGPCQKKVPKNSALYRSTDNHFWCAQCFGSESDEILLVDGTKYLKRELKRERQPDPLEEPFVCCYSCKRWMHQVCAMLNTKRGQDGKDDFLCPICVLQLADQQPKYSEQYRKKGTARDLPETEFSRFVQHRLVQQVDKIQREAKASNASAEVLRHLDQAKSLSVRVVMSRDTDVWTRDGLKKVYPDFPSSFNSKQKALLLFQKLDGVDVLLFIMFLQEYGSDCAAPNTRCVYLAYLDSIHYFRPAMYRTTIYHELITSTIEYTKTRGFTRFFIWACPPVSGDDYVFNVHPKTQRTPKPDRLRVWYYALLEAARQRGIVVSVTTFFDEYFCRLSHLGQVPYFEGDCWTGYAEHYITDMQQKGTNPRSLQAKGDLVQKAWARKQAFMPERRALTNKRVRGGGGGGNKRAEEGGSEDGILICPPPRALETTPMQSALMFRISTEIERMKDDFIVVKLFQECATCGTPQDYPGALYWTPEAYKPELDPHDYKKKRYSPPFCLCHECYCQAYLAEFGTVFEGPVPSFPPEEWKDAYEEYVKNAAQTKAVLCDTEEMEVEESSTSFQEEMALEEGGSGSSKKRGKGTTPQKKGGKKRVRSTEADESPEEEGGIEVLPVGKNAKPVNPYGNMPCTLAELSCHVAMIRPTTEDPDPLMECPIFHVREDFLDLCKGNKYQFDDLRRAKHSTMMTLFHLHNPESDSFVHHCNSCNEIIPGVRYTCNTSPCTDFDLCPKCNERSTHMHPLEKIVPANCASPAAAKSAPSPKSTTSGKMSQTDKEMLRAMINTFSHAAVCTHSNCGLAQCNRVKSWVAHMSSCPGFRTHQCDLCRKGYAMLTHHARSCRVPLGQCPVFECATIRAKTRESVNQNQDRRIHGLMQRQTQQAQVSNTTPEVGTQEDSSSAPEREEGLSPRLPYTRLPSFGGKGKKPNVKQ